ncbi:MAG: hypothetical protein KA535_08840 [Azonexus sp.]|nr:hypothetical protein [Azonexus sp.]
MPPSSLVLALLAGLALAFAVIFCHFSGSTATDAARLAANRALVEHYGLTDLALFTEARYTRHPSQADLHSAFQDHPAALEHFPTGSLVAPRSLPLFRDAPLAGKTTSPD